VEEQVAQKFRGSDPPRVYAEFAERPTSKSPTNCDSLRLHPTIKPICSIIPAIKAGVESLPSNVNFVQWIGQILQAEYWSLIEQAQVAQPEVKALYRERLRQLQELHDDHAVASIRYFSQC
jgi:hypothetical protein